MSIMGTDLSIRRHPKLGLVAGVLVLALVIAMMVWRAQNPSALPLSSRTISATTPVGSAIYVGMFHGGNDLNRSLHLSGVKVHATSNTEVSLTPLLCKDGAVEVTTDVTPFCSAILNPEGETLSPSDSIVVRVSSDVPAIAVIDPIRLGFREALQWGTLPAGAGAVVQVVAR